MLKCIDDDDIEKSPNKYKATADNQRKMFQYNYNDDNKTRQVIIIITIMS
uniref:Uncharacterized protein n=1 Tax=Tetranychus urticae TaxID=32264 RepID=T1KU10_TETUR